MRFGVVLGIFWLCGAAAAQTLSVEKLEQFLRSAAQRHDADKDIAAYLSKAKLSEKLDDRTIQQLQSEGVVQPRTLHALWALRDSSAALAVPAAPKARTAVGLPEISNEDQAAIIRDVREYALHYTRDLPDFICAEQVKRFLAPLPRKGDSPAWREGDTLLIKLSYFKQKEQYRLLTVNFKLTDQDYEKVGGSKEFGSFGTLLHGIFDPAGEARFEYDHTSQLGNRGIVLAFRYFIDLDRSNYELVWDNTQRIRTAYSGMVLVSADSHRVMRVSVKAENIPADFPIRAAQTQLDYDWVELSGHKFLLPATAQVIMAREGGLTKNDEIFANYQKYSADTEIKFDTEPLPPASPERAKETRK